jgi:hypothetical protein
MATLKDLRSDLRQRLGDPSAASGGFTDGELDFWLNDAQRRLAMLLPEKVKERFAKVRMIGWTDGKEQYDLPDDLLDIVAVLDHSGRLIRPSSLANMPALMDNVYFAPITAERAYYRLAGKIGIRPIPAA